MPHDVSVGAVVVILLVVVVVDVVGYEVVEATVVVVGMVRGSVV